MPKLRTKTETVISVNYGDLDAFVEQVTGRTFDFVFAEECGNDTSHMFEVVGGRGKCSLETWTRGMEEAEYWIANGDGEYGGCGAGTLLDWLCSKGHIEPGNYRVDVCW